MNHSKVAAGTLALTIFFGTAIPALASENSVESEVEVEVHSSVEVNRGPNFPGAGFLQGIRNRVEGRDGEKHASNTEMREEKRAEKEEKREQKREDKTSSAIDKRIEALTKLKERLSNLKLIDAAVLANITAGIDAQIAKLEALKTQIASGTASTTLKAEVKNLKTFSIVEPKAHIAAGASRINAVVTQMTTFADKLQARINAAKTAGTDTSAAEAALADMKTQLADAKAKADAAVSGTQNLQPDNGDATVRASNLAALKDARTKLAAAAKDLAAARHDIAKIYAVVKGSGGMGANATTTTP